jgi:hypothetical protein
MPDTLMEAHPPNPPPSLPLVMEPVPAFFERGLGWILLLIIPLSAVFVYALHTQTVDLEWLFFAQLSQWEYANPERDAALAREIAAFPPLWHFGKQGFWRIVILTLDTLIVGLSCMLFSQLFGVRAKLRHFFVLGLWAKATYLLTASIITLRIVLQDTPTHILTTDLDPFSWNSLLSLPGNGGLQYFTSYHGPIAFIGMAILAYGFRQLSGRSWTQAACFAVLPYAIALGIQYYVFGVFFNSFFK